MSIIEEKRITLAKPVVIGSGDAAITYNELKLREPLMGELKQAHRAGTNLDVLTKLIQLVCGMPLAVVDQLPQRTVEECGRVLGQFSEDASSSSPSEVQT
jgi:hypothetical protein